MFHFVRGNFGGILPIPSILLLMNENGEGGRDAICLGPLLLCCELRFSFPHSFPFSKTALSIRDSWCNEHKFSFRFFKLPKFQKMSQQYQKSQHLEQHKKEENENEWGKLLAKVISLLKKQQKEEETTSSSSSGLEYNLELEITQNSLDHCRRVPLPLELNCQIFECLKFRIQRKFIGGLGRGIYRIFRQKVLTKCKILRNPEQNVWDFSNTGPIISYNGLQASDNTKFWKNVFAKKGFPITGQLSRKDNFPGTILYYFEATIMLSSYRHINVGLSNGHIPDSMFVGELANSYAIQCRHDCCCLSGEPHAFEWPNGVKPKLNGPGKVFGCGLLLNPENKLSIFFTRNGILMRKPILINCTANALYPTVSMYGDATVEANFGDDSFKPFSYDIAIFPGFNIE